MMQEDWFSAKKPPRLADGWSLQQLTTPSRQVGLSSLRTRPNGRVYVTQVTGPLDLTWGADGLYIADGMSLYGLDWGELRSIATIFSPNFPGFIRGLHAVSSDTFIVTTSVGTVARYRPASAQCELLAQGLDQLYGVVVAASGAVFVAELGKGRVLSLSSGGTQTLASGLDKPHGVAIAPDGACLVAESGAGCVVKLSGSRANILVDDLRDPQGLVVHEGVLYIVDAGAKALIAYDFKTKRRNVIAEELPVGAPFGLRGATPYSRPQGPFAGIAASPTGTLYVSADADGSLIALRRDRR